MDETRIALDAMGGDDAPHSPVEGAVLAVQERPVHVVLVGREEEIDRELHRLEVAADVGRRLEVVHAEEVVEMDDPPIAPLRRKRRSSIRVCAELVKKGEAAAMVSAGNTGAAMVAAKTVLGVAEGVTRPALATTVPTVTGWAVLLDVGANVDTTAAQLREFAVMGDLFCQEIVGVESPRVGLLSIGEEQGKGNDAVKEAFEGLETAGINFIGNVEGGDIFKGTADVIVCDGFVGNVVLKSSEALAEMVFHMIREEIMKSPLTRLGGGLAKPALLRFRERTAYDEFGGAPLLGLNAGCFIGHGRSNPKAIQNAILKAASFADAKVDERISRRLERVVRAREEIVHAREEAEPAQAGG